MVGRFSPFNVHKWVLKLGLKNLEKLMYCVGNERLQKTKREGGRLHEISQVAKFCKLGNFYTATKALPSATTTKQRTKFMRKCK